MARLPRLDLAHVPQHVVQRGIDRQPCFLGDNDYREYLHNLADAATHCGCAIHAYVLMPNHVHLLVTGIGRGAVSRMMQRLGRRYVAYFNARHDRTGTLWAGRFKSSLIDSRQYLLKCQCYIESNPVRAALVSDPAEYRWSSYGCNALGEPDRLVIPHSEYLEIGRDPVTRRAAYRDIFACAVSAEDVADISAHLRQQKALGSSWFQTKVEALLARDVVVRSRGRPRLEDNWL